MANTKKTNAPEKTSAPPKCAKTICSFCLELMDPGQRFEEHLIQCYKSRWPCSTCGKTFKRESYLLKHKKNQHNPVKCDTKVETTREPDKESGITSDKDESDWQTSPDISLSRSDTDSDDDVDSDRGKMEETLSENPSGDNECTCILDKRSTVSKDNSSDLNAEIVKGRIIRMPTKPHALVEPKKPRLEETKASTSSTKISSAGSTIQDRDSEKVRPKSQSFRVGTTRNITSFKAYAINCSKQIDDNRSEQKTVVEEDGEIIYENKVSRKRQKTDSVSVNIVDLMNGLDTFFSYQVDRLVQDEPNFKLQ